MSGSGRLSLRSRLLVLLIAVTAAFLLIMGGVTTLVLTRAELLERVWGRGYTGQPQVVETYVSYLRRKLHRLGPPLIHTRRGVGYMLRGPALAASLS